MTEIKFKIPFSLLGWNEWEKSARGNKFKAAALKKKLTFDIAILARQAVKGCKFDKITISFEWIEKNKRRDPDNICAAKKFIIDGIVAAGIIENDGWSQVIGFSDSWRVDKDQPGCVVTISEVTSINE